VAADFHHVLDQILDRLQIAALIACDELADGRS
jgi:hypothetical protein